MVLFCRLSVPVLKMAPPVAAVPPLVSTAFRVQEGGVCGQAVGSALSQQPGVQVRLTVQQGGDWFRAARSR